MVDEMNRHVARFDLSPASEFSEADIAAWKKGAESFRAFWGLIQDRFYSAPNTATRGDVGSLQAIFLGEKPAGWDNGFALRFKTELERFGLVFSDNGEFIYNPNLVTRVVLDHPDVFTVEAQLDVAKIMNNIKTMGNIAIGLVLGFPESAVRGYEEREKQDETIYNGKIKGILVNLLGIIAETNSELADGLAKRCLRMRGQKSGGGVLVSLLFQQCMQHKERLGLKDVDEVVFKDSLERVLRLPPDRTGVNVYGIAWRDLPERQPDSLEKEKRLKAAFEQSGILDII